MKLVGISNSFEHSKVLGDKTVLQKVLLEIQMRELNKGARTTRAATIEFPHSHPATETGRVTIEGYKRGKEMIVWLLFHTHETAS